MSCITMSCRCCVFESLIKAGSRQGLLNPSNDQTSMKDMLLNSICMPHSPFRTTEENKALWPKQLAVLCAWRCLFKSTNHRQRRIKIQQIHLDSSSWRPKKKKRKVIGPAKNQLQHQSLILEVKLRVCDTIIKLQTRWLFKIKITSSSLFSLFKVQRCNREATMMFQQGKQKS